MSERHVFDVPGGPMKGTNLYLCRRIAGRGFCLKPESDPVHRAAGVKSQTVVPNVLITQEVAAGVKV